MLLHDYIGKQEDLFGEIVEYVDDGYTGTNFNRPAFQKMIVDLKQGDIKVIMVKDLSRLGRDYIGVGDYIEQIFPLMGVRFIAVNNSFDSMKLNNGTPGIEVAVSNLVNNMEKDSGCSGNELEERESHLHECPFWICVEQERWAAVGD